MFHVKHVRVPVVQVWFDRICLAVCLAVGRFMLTDEQNGIMR